MEKSTSNTLPQRTQAALAEAFITSFDQKIFSQARINLIFASLVVLELILLIVLFPLLIQSALFAFMLAGFLLTVFGFLLIRQYYETQKLLFFDSLVRELLLKISQQEVQGDALEKHIATAKICTYLADRLYQREYGYYPLPKLFESLSQFSEVLSCSLHWRDLFAIREILLKQAVEEHLILVRQQPTNPDGHALLANAYVMLSGLYLNPNTLHGEESDRYHPRARSGPEMQAKFKATAEKAVEEFKILKEYSPNDPWIYSQLAYSYRDLQMPHEEKGAYEAILALRPHDNETLFKLGMLYFQQGENARGLKIYEDLKKAHYSKAEELLGIYGNQ